MYANKPEMAEKWEAHTSDKELPKHVKEKAWKRVTNEETRKGK